MVDPGDEKSKKAPIEEVSSKQENVDTTLPNPIRTADGGRDVAPRAYRGGAGASAAAGGNTGTPGCDKKSTVLEKKLKRRPDDPGASSSSSNAGGLMKKPKKKGQLLDLPSFPPRCYICRKTFQSWKAVFGHMRKHEVGKERERGALPPPVFSPPCRASPERGCGSGVAVSAHDEVDQEDLQEQLASTLLDLAQEVLFSSSSSSSSKADGLDIDLNQTHDPNSHDGEEGGRFDLNKSPPPENDEL
ncbi:hypothetical protein ACOSP7_022528 [Xanthoceras sorbifolium]|uniref:C2H2-type domain-containing protein n=1 Tax=Xanthoceras sorbifolium TaxID=99658 RepID=A0ABQ8HPB7_9ROSI|nr:hypothetical protein JRO89_XS08G0112600 [Xanthoceras sorbifolium]